MLTELTVPAAAGSGKPCTPPWLLLFSGGSSWLQGPSSTLPSRPAPPGDSCSLRGVLLLQLLVDRASRGCLTGGLQGWVWAGESSQVLGTPLLGGGRGGSTGSLCLRGLARAAFLQDTGEVVFLEDGGVGTQPSVEKEVGFWAWCRAEGSAGLCCREEAETVWRDSWLPPSRACLPGTEDPSFVEGVRR